VIEKLLVRVAYQQRNTVDDLVLNPKQQQAANLLLSLANNGRDFTASFKLRRYQIGRQTLNAPTLRSKATGDLNDFNQFSETIRRQ